MIHKEKKSEKGGQMVMIEKIDVATQEKENMIEISALYVKKE